MIIPLGGSAFPDSATQLRTQIQEGVQAVGLQLRSLSLEAPAWPAVESALLDCSDSTLPGFDSLPRWEGWGEGQLQVQSLELRAQPLTVRGLALDLLLQAQAARLTAARLSGGRGALALQHAGSGTLSLSASLEDLERLAQTLLAEQARQHGADVVQTRLRLQSRGPRALSFEAEVTAKVMMMKAPITVTGEADLDDDLQLHLSQLKLTGSGMAATLARGFLQPQFAKLEQRPISLRALSLGDLRLRDISLAVEGDRLRLQGAFGS